MFNIFRKKPILADLIPEGFVDIHSHILPGIDDGAKEALTKGKSLLAAGIKKVMGKFNKGDHIKILDKNHKEYARGLSSFSSDEISKIRGQWIEKDNIKYMPIFHPSYLLRNPSKNKGKPKWLTWQDLKKVKKELNSI